MNESFLGVGSWRPTGAERGVLAWPSWRLRMRFCDTLPCALPGTWQNPHISWCWCQVVYDSLICSGSLGILRSRGECQSACWASELGDVLKSKGGNSPRRPCRQLLLFYVSCMVLVFTILCCCNAGKPDEAQGCVNKMQK